MTRQVYLALFYDARSISERLGALSLAAERCGIGVLLLAMLGASAALAQTQNVPPPPPVVLLPQTSIANACTLGCDSSAMFCLNTCVQPATATAPANQQCSLSCTTSQLVCKQRC